MDIRPVASLVDGLVKRGIGPYAISVLRQQTGREFIPFVVNSQV
jgi:hypothetical protein